MKLRFYKKGGEWYADVKQCTEAQNRMVLGADKALDIISNGKDDILLLVETGKLENYGDIQLKRIIHDCFGGTYFIRTKVKGLPKIAWLCNVCHVVFGEHPEYINISIL